MSEIPKKVDGYQITHELLAKAIAKDHDCTENEVVVQDFSMAEGSNLGENFTCVMKAVEVSAKVKGVKKTLNYMVKCVPAMEYRAQFLEAMNGFKKECVVYNTLIAKYQDMRKKAGLFELAVPKCFMADLSKGIIIMENLKTKGYGMLNKKEGEEITLETAKAVLREMAGFHATGYHFIETYQGGFEKFKEDFEDFCSNGWLNDDKPEFKAQMEGMMTQMYSGMLSVVKACVAKDDEHLVERMEEFNKIREAVVEEILKPTSGFNTLLHNDMHMNNVMYKKKPDGSLEHLVLLDLQLMRRSRPAVDLVYFFGSSTYFQFRAKHMEELLKYYHGCLSNELEAFGYSKSTHTYQQLNQDFDDCWPFGFVIAIMHMQLLVMDFDGEEAFDFEAMSDEKKYMEMAEKTAAIQLQNAKKNKPYLEKVFGMMREAVDRKIL